MDRARRATFAAILLVLAAGWASIGTGGPAIRMLAARPAAAVSWPVSTLVLSEVQTGGASASDEFVEIANAGLVTVDLAGLEVVYVTATGGTITRKATWPAARPLEPGRHLLLANTSGVYATIADATYSGGLAATGGALVLRRVGGSPLDAVGWGDALNSFVEGTPAAASIAGSSVERRPGGIDGNAVDTNDNVVDWFIQAAPSPQGISAPPVPAPVVTGTPAPSDPSVPPSPVLTPPPSDGSPPPTGGPSATPNPTPSASATASPTPAPSATAPATPDPTGTPGPTATPDPTATPGPTASAAPTPSADPTPPGTSPEPSASGLPDPTPGPDPGTSPGPSPAPSGSPQPTPSESPDPSIEPSPTPPSPATPGPSTAPPDPSPSTSPPVPSPIASPTAAPSPSRSPAVLEIAVARSLTIGSAATIFGVLTAPLGLLEDGRAAFVEDGTGGIALYLDVAPTVTWPAGTVVRATGSIDERYAARTLRASLTMVEPMGPAILPGPLPVTTGGVGEPVEGRRVIITGWTTGTPTVYADGTGLLVDDGSGAIRAIISPDALGGTSLPSGTLVHVIGPVGQRDSTGTGLGGYRVHATIAGDLILPSPSPTSSGSLRPDGSPTPPATSPWPSLPTPSPSGPTSPPVTSPSPSPSPSSPGATATPTVTPAPSLSPRTVSIAEARTRPLGAAVAVEGVVTAEAGRLGTPSLFAIADPTGGLVIHLPDGVLGPGRASLVALEGILAAPYGQLELRIGADGLRLVGNGYSPVPARLSAATELGETTESRLVTIDGTVAAPAWRSTSHDISFDILAMGGGRVRVMADASSGVTTASIRAGQAYRLTGIVGQRASRRGALDGYRIWLRDPLDISVLATTTTGGSTQGSSTPAAVIPISVALARTDEEVIIEGIVTAPATLLDASGRRIVIQDADGAAIEALLPVGSPAPPPGSRVRLHGTVGRAYGAPRIRAGAIEILAGRATAEPLLLAAQPGTTLEWRVARAAGTIVQVTRLGARWRAELDLDGVRVLIDGLPGSGIPSTTLVAGRQASVVGIVRRPYPTATDQRFSIVPRGPSDVDTRHPAPSSVSLGTGWTGVVTSPLSGQPVEASLEGAIDVDLAALAEHPGERVRIGGLIEVPTADGFELDDGTAVGRVILAGDAASFIGLLEHGDAVNAVGLVVPLDGAAGEWAVVVSAPDGLFRVGALGEPQVVAPDRASSDAATSSPARPVTDPGARRMLRLGELLPSGSSGAAGLLSLAVLSAASLVATLARRRRAREQSEARIAARLAELARPRSEAA